MKDLWCSKKLLFRQNDLDIGLDCFQKLHLTHFNIIYLHRFEPVFRLSMTYIIFQKYNHFIYLIFGHLMSNQCASRKYEFAYVLLSSVIFGILYAPHQRAIIIYAVWHTNSANTWLGIDIKWVSVLVKWEIMVYHKRCNPVSCWNLWTR